AGFASGAAAGAAVYRRWFGDRRERLDVYFDDGSFVTFGPESRDAARLLPLARQVLILAGNAGGQAAGVRPDDRAAGGGPGARPAA
ncbi:MAG TPA: hypothetical protein VJ814_04645, partial [Gaiellaceae bacterium]|nr:hypothetical protein [Gaiellaceae bacterium]